eukprot:COSAG03_NODE_2788_length_2453_cov_10.391249_3_plen_81_part_00
MSPGDVVFGDADGVLVGSLDAFEAVVDKAEAVADVEDRLSELSLLPPPPPPPLSLCVCACAHARSFRGLIRIAVPAYSLA